MCKNPLRDSQKSDVPYVERASVWADALVRKETRGPGDLDNAMRRAARASGVPYSAFWALRYRRPKDILASIYFALRDAYEAERARQLQALKHELEITAAQAGDSAHSVRAAQALVDEASDVTKGSE
ncbi:hypothetical protein [Methylocella tundrae]|uniref:Uncharacterized protein n=1 Tax=Methylocella tundrae TaxID=227605 RepID=A0A4U8YYL5_METTU|nr:hypothetical protein [Methylocella tundrae]WPP05482.1 hypothetical protein SIN04_06570 [Methylocella tundrae]VFU07904.1 conserved protein of unknown function [Methylocella tundrae]